MSGAARRHGDGTPGSGHGACSVAVSGLALPVRPTVDRLVPALVGHDIGEKRPEELPRNSGLRRGRAADDARGEDSLASQIGVALWEQPLRGYPSSDVIVARRARRKRS